MELVTLKRRLGVALACSFGAGYMPVAPGTTGSAVGVLLAWALQRAGGPWAPAIAILPLFLISVWAANQAELHYGEHDSPHIVIDEVVGQLITLAATPCGPATLLAGFGLFRLFDSVKPWPARWVHHKVDGGLGVILDDVVAGLQAALLTSALVYSGLLAKLFSPVGLLP